MPKTSRLQQAIALRDAALAVLKRRGERSDEPRVSSLQIISDADRPTGHPEPGNAPDDPQLSISHRTSLDHGWSLPHGLDVWANLKRNRGKVLNIEWGDGGQIHLVSFRRGPWEAELLAMATSHAQLRVVKTTPVK